MPCLNIGFEIMLSSSQADLEHAWFVWQSLNGQKDHVAWTLAGFCSLVLQRMSRRDPHIEHQPLHCMEGLVVTWKHAGQQRAAAKGSALASPMSSNTTAKLNGGGNVRVSGEHCCTDGVLPPSQHPKGMFLPISVQSGWTQLARVN